MTEATATLSSKPTSTTPSINYQVAMPQPESHLFEVTLQVKQWQAPILDLKMPVWTPGSYLVREYARHLQNFSASDGKGHPLSKQKVSKNHWQVQTNGVSEVVVKYQIFANELSVRTNHLDATHGYFNPAALCFYIPGFERAPIQISIAPPRSDWRVATPLERDEERGRGGSRGENYNSVGAACPQDILRIPNSELIKHSTLHTFIAPDFDTLVDSPFEIGCHQLYEFEVLGKPHQLAIWGEGNADPERIISDIKKIIPVEAQIFGGLPYDRYLFILHLTSSGFGGLEHKDACSLIYSQFGFRDREKYNRFMQLVAHEFFHLWNIKRLRPQALETFDYEKENYTTSLWFSEGTTSYYDLTIPLRAGIYDSQTFLDKLGKEITRLQTTPGRFVQPASESSFDAWIKLYRPDANSSNSQLSYYLKGELISLLLDLLIRSRHDNQRSFDNVMQQMWQQFGREEIGFTPAQLQAVIESVAEMDLSDFFHRYIDSTEELPFNEYLEPFGLQVEGITEDEPTPYLGITTKSEHGRDLIKSVAAGSPAQRAGIDAGDELLAINGIKVTSEQLSDRLKDYRGGDTVDFTVFHQDRLCSYPVTLDLPRPSRYQVVAVKNPSDAQKHNLAGWLGNEK
ncbi:MAG: M61 family metallopeptidase [Cyanosarcina radialis HA8281-LM2]|nr:M61 family metallopeptidase [Cyanosarcina radialis HA8281-LM2]